MQNCFDIVKQSKTHIISYETKILVSRILPWQPLRHKEYPHFKKGMLFVVHILSNCV